MPGLGRLVTVLLAVALLSGCSVQPEADGRNPGDGGHVRITELRLAHDGLDRSFRVTAPAADAGDPLPVVVALHGAGGSASTFGYLTGFDLAVSDAEFLLVEPDGTGADSGSRTWNAGGCCGASIGSVDDVGFLAAMLDRVSAGFPVDEDRVYLTGFSNGGMLAYRAACELGERIAGIAVVAGTMNVDACPAPAPVPVLAVHGEDDTVVPFEGGEGDYGDPRVKPWDNLPVETAVGFWADRNGCSSDPVETTVGAARVLEWGGCSVALWVIEGGRHTWFGGPASAVSGLEPEGTPSVTELVLDFFELSGSGSATS